ncbi:MAG TPA: pitrilysin family protein [Candidatus Paceibacterota bacterium]
MYQERKLNNGTRLVTYHQKDLDTVTMMVLVKTGALFEDAHEKGIAHFLEHMCFKDTKNYTKEDLLKEFEMRGAVSNAFTAYECTAYYAKTTKDMYEEVFPLISEIYHYPQFPEDEIVIEKGVVIGEINMNKDLPQMMTYKKHQEFLYGIGKPHGDAILGSIESVNSLTRDMLKDFHDRFYIPENTVIMIAGNFDESNIVELCEKHFTKPAGSPVLPIPPTQQSTGGAINLVEKESEQSHIIYSYNTESFYHKDATLLTVLGNILGQGLTSRLFMRLREKMGAGYYAQAELDETYDAGALLIATGTEHARVQEVIMAIHDECTKLINEEISEAELKKVKDMTLARHIMGLESSDSRADYNGVRAILGLPERNAETLKHELEVITPADVIRIARQYFIPETLLVTVVGPALVREQIDACHAQLFN